MRKCKIPPHVLSRPPGLLKGFDETDMSWDGFGFNLSKN